MSLVRDMVWLQNRYEMWFQYKQLMLFDTENLTFLIPLFDNPER